MDATPVMRGNRRFTCLSRRLVRLEFSPTGIFEDRNSIVAFAPKQSLPFDRVEERDGKTTLQVGQMTIISQQNERDFFPSNLRIDWKRDGLTETWQFGDRDYRNLGGTVRSLDYYNRNGLLTGVHPASNASPDDYLHSEAEFWEVMRIYQHDGKMAWAVELGQQGVHGALRYMPHLVYNRHIPMAYDLTKFQPGLLSRNGYFLLNDSTGPVLDADGFPIERDTPGTRDLYFFAYGSDYKAALKDFCLLSGPVPLPGRNIFGTFFCRWPAFTESEARAIIERFEQEGMPLSVLVLDLEWHTPDFWGWDWNQAAYPDPEGFFQWAHSKNVQVTVNVHPKYILSSDTHFTPFVQASGTESKAEPVRPEFIAMGLVKSPADRWVEINLANKAEALAYTRVCLEPVLKQGLDLWWLDMNSASLNGADGQILSSKVFYETTETENQRGRLLSRYGGLGSHRYGIFFTGDTASQWEVLQSECEFTIRSGQVEMVYVSHDIGGFSHEPAPLIDPDLYIRWLQFGVFSPVLRFHSAPGAGSRQPWDYGPRNLEIARRWLKVRHSLQPYLYTAAHQVYESGLPLVRGLYLEHPTTEACYRFDEFFFGDSLLVAPILTASNHRKVYLPEGLWYAFDSGEHMAGDQEISVYAGLDQVPVYVKAGTILTRQGDQIPAAQPFVSDLLLDIYPGADGEAVLYEDDGVTRSYQLGDCCLTRFSLVDSRETIRIAGQPTLGKAMIPERSLSLQVALPTVPANISLNGATIHPIQHRYDATNHRLLINLGIVAVTQDWEVRIEMM